MSADILRFPTIRPRTGTFRPIYGRRERTFATNADRLAYENGYQHHPLPCYDALGTPFAQGWFDRESEVNDNVPEGPDAA